MPIQDIRFPHKEEKSFQGETVAAMSAEKKRSKKLHLFLRAVALFAVPTFLFFCILPFTAWGEERGLQGAIDKMEETITDVTKLLGGGETPAGENFEVLNLEKDNQPAIADVSKPLADLGDKLKFEKKNLPNGKEKFAMKTLKGENVEFSDSDETSADPYLKINKWGNEASLKIKIPHATGGSKNLKDNRLKIKNNGFQVEVYPKSPEEITETIAGKRETFTINDEGGVEFDIVLSGVPISNIFEFPIEDEGLKFYYQAPLDPEHPTWSDRNGDGEADLFRPEMTVGSYAVYYEAQKGAMKNEADAEKYKTGKAFHIYRPKVTDASGNEIWGELGYDEINHILKVTVDRSWLDSASYPVRIDPDVGYTSIGVLSAAFAAGDIGGTPGTGAAGVATSVSVYMRAKTASGNTECNIYNADFHSLDTTGTAVVANSTTPHWINYAYTAGPTLTASSTYYITVWVAKASTVYCDEATGVVLYDIKAYDGVWPDPSYGIDTRGLILSIYATYTASSSQAFPSAVDVSGGSALFF